MNVVKTLIEDLNADPNGKNKFDMTPLHHAAVHIGLDQNIFLQ